MLVGVPVYLNSMKMYQVPNCVCTPRNHVYCCPCMDNWPRCYCDCYPNSEHYSSCRFCDKNECEHIPFTVCNEFGTHDTSCLKCSKGLDLSCCNKETWTGKRSPDCKEVPAFEFTDSNCRPIWEK